MSKPPIGGIIPLKMFKYGSVKEHNALKAPLFQSIDGNQVSNTLISNKKEKICAVLANTENILYATIFTVRISYTLTFTYYCCLLFRLPIFEIYS